MHEPGFICNHQDGSTDSLVRTLSLPDPGGWVLCSLVSDIIRREMQDLLEIVSSCVWLV
jgi:hypothetical protein